MSDVTQQVEWTPPTPTPKPSCECDDARRPAGDFLAGCHSVNCPVWQWERRAGYPELIGNKCRGEECGPPAIPAACPSCGAPVVEHKDKGMGWESATYKCGGRYESKPQCQTHTDIWWGHCPAINAPAAIVVEHVPSSRPVSCRQMAGRQRNAEVAEAFADDAPPPGHVEPAVRRPVPVPSDAADARPFVAYFDDGSSMRVNAFNSDAARVEATDTARADGKTCSVVRVHPVDVTPRRKRA